jgi:hypothetical protein
VNVEITIQNCVHIHNGGFEKMIKHYIPIVVVSIIAILRSSNPNIELYERTRVLKIYIGYISQATHMCPNICKGLPFLPMS